MTRIYFSSRASGVVAGWLCLLVGCQGITPHKPFCHKPVPVANQAPPATVDVGGLVAKPGSLEIPAQGLTLRRALALAGQTPQATVATSNPQSASPQVLDQFADAFGQVGQADYQLQLIEFYDNLANVFRVNKVDLGRTKQTYLDTASGLLTQLSPVQQKAIAESQLSVKASALGGLQERVTLRTSHPELDWSQIGESPTTLEADNAAVDAASKDLASAKAAALARMNVDGGVVVNVPAGMASVNLAAIVRQTGNSPTTYYIPYDAATTGDAGNIVLAAGDLVQVLDYQRTPFATGAADPLVGGAGTFLIQGLVKQPGLKPSAGTLANVLQKNGPATNDPSAVVMVERNATVGSGKELFVIPVGTAQVGAMSNFAVRGGDVYTVTTMPRVPIVLHGLVTQALRPNGTTIVTNQLLNPQAGQPKPGSLQDRWQQHVQEGINNGDDVTAQALKNLQGACKTLTTRVGGALRVP